jgi:hypothetical protein
MAFVLASSAPQPVGCGNDNRLSVVGAAGFEPATWSTQNSRATRLRYAPLMLIHFELLMFFDTTKSRALNRYAGKAAKE